MLELPELVEGATIGVGALMGTAVVPAGATGGERGDEGGGTTCVARRSLLGVRRAIGALEKDLLSERTRWLAAVR